MLLRTFPHADKAIELTSERKPRAEIPFLYDIPVICCELPAGQLYWAYVETISAEAIILLLDKSMAPGTMLVIEMKTLGPSVSLSVVAQVVHSTKQEDQSAIVSCQFLSRPHEVDLLAMLVASRQPVRRFRPASR
jgi:PilZ domain